MDRFCFLPEKRLIHVKISKAVSDLPLIFMLTLIIFAFDYSVCEYDLLWSHKGESAFNSNHHKNRYI